VAENISESLPTFYIEPPKGWASIGLRELWDYRELLYFLTWRDVKVRYKQTALGAAWAIIQPLFMMLVFSLFFGRLAKIPSDGIPYPIFTFCALLPWQLFAHALTESSNSLVANERLITKVYFPRLVVPMAAVLGGLVDFAVAFAILLVMMFYYGIVPGWAIVTLPGFILLAVMTALGVGLWLSALNVKYRDVRYTINFLIQFWLFATPVAYPSSLVPAKWRAVRPEPDGRCGGRFSLGATGEDGSPGRNALGFSCRCNRDPDRRPLLLPPHGTGIRRRGLSRTNQWSIP
jgi:lipopolysaccharide transport system permease protein